MNFLTPENQLQAIQPNAITSARYEYSQMQKDFMYHFMEKMSGYMTKEQTLNRDLFGNIRIEMELKEICSSNNYNAMLEAIRELLRKPISYYYNRGKDTYDVTTHLIASVVHKRGSGKISITTTEESLPVLTYIGAGFTAFNLTTALSLPSFYAKRMYELCCRWKDKGFYRVRLDEFRKMFMIERKFKKHCDLEKNVLQLSERLLSEMADLTFTYIFRKENGSKAFNWLELCIINKVEGIKDANAWYHSLYGILYPIYHDSTAMHVLDFLADHNELKRAEERFKRLKKDIDSGKIKPHGMLAYVNKVLKTEFEVPEPVLMSEAVKQNKKKKDAKAKTRMDQVKRKKENEVRIAAARANYKPSAQEALGGLFEKSQAEEPRTGNTQSIGDLIKDLARK